MKCVLLQSKKKKMWKRVNKFVNKNYKITKYQTFNNKVFIIKNFFYKVKNLY